MNSVKRTLSLLMALLLLALMGCKDTTENKIVGIWQGHNYTTNYSKMTEKDLKDIKMITEYTFYTLNADKTFSETVFDFTSTGKWSYDTKTKKLALTYIVKNGPPNRANPNYEVISITDKEMKCKITSNDSTYEVYTFVRRNAVSPLK